MQIQRIQSYPYNTTFKAYEYFRYKSDELGHVIDNIANSSKSWFMRTYPSIEERVNIFLKEFKNVPKVNFYDFGCSNGSDIYSVLIGLHLNGGYDVLNKFGPAKCRDICYAPIYAAKKGEYLLNVVEMSEIDRYTNGDFDKYFYSPLRCEDMYRTHRWHISPYIKDYANFEIGDITEDYKMIEPYNSIVQTRNMWPYLKPEQKQTLAKNLHDQMRGNAILVIGGIEKDDPFGNRTAAEYLEDAGFVQHPDNEYIYRVAR